MTLRTQYSPGASYGWVTAELPTTLGGTGVETVIRNASGAVQARCNIYWSTCNARAFPGNAYRATVEDPNGNVVGISSTWSLTTNGFTEEVESGIDLVETAGLFTSATQVCNTLLNYPGTHTARSTVNDQYLACDAGISSGWTLPQILRSVAGAGGGTAVLWWLAHQGTTTTLPAPPLG